MAAKTKTGTKKKSEARRKADERAKMLRKLEVQWRKEHRLLERAVEQAERDARARRYQRAIALARRLYRKGARRTECAEHTGLSVRTVMRHTADIRRQRAAKKGRSEDESHGRTVDPGGQAQAGRS